MFYWIASLVSLIWISFRQVILAIFGRVHWHPPRWMWFFQKGFQAIARNWLLLKQWYLVHWSGGGVSRIKLLIVEFLVLSGPIGFGGYYWYLSTKPEPVFTTINLILPELKEPKKQWVSIKELKEPLLLKFGDSVAPLKEIGKVVSKPPVFYPPKKGLWKWQDPKTLVFEPEHSWKLGEQLQLNIKNLLTTENIFFKSIDFDLNIFPLKLTSIKSQLYANPLNPMERYATFTFQANAPLNSGFLQNGIRCKKWVRRIENKKSSSNEWVETKQKIDCKGILSKDRSRVFVKSGNIEIPKQTYQIRAMIDPGVRSVIPSIGTLSKSTSSTLVPSLYERLKVQTTFASFHQTFEGPSQSALTIEFNEIMEEKNLKEYLDIYLLPINRPQEKGINFQKNFYWSNASQVTDTVLNKSEKLAIDFMPAAKKWKLDHHIKLPLVKNRFYFVRVKEELQSRSGFRLKDSDERVVRIGSPSPTLKFKHEGSLLSANHTKKMQVFSRANQAIKFKAYRLKLEDVHHFLSQTGGKYSKHYFYNGYFDERNIADYAEEIRNLTVDDLGASQVTEFDIASLKFSEPSSSGIYVFKIVNYFPRERYEGGVADHRLVIKSDIAMVIKENKDKSHDVYNISISEGNALEGVVVSIISKNGSTLRQCLTDTNGHCQLDSVKGFKNHEQPSGFLASKGKDHSFLPFDRRDRVLNQSQFDISGLKGLAAKGLRALAFTDRGLYRPGEQVNIAVNVNDAKLSQRLEGIPVLVHVNRPDHKKVLSRKIELGEFNEGTLSFETKDFFPIGNYQVNIYLGRTKEHSQSNRLIGSTQFRVAEFEPDRFLVTTSFVNASKVGWNFPSDLKVKVSSRTFYGTGVSNAQVKGNLVLQPISPNFEKFNSYQFPIHHGEAQISDIKVQAVTNESGEASLDFSNIHNIQGFFKAGIQFEIIDRKGGNPIRSYLSRNISTFQNILGYKSESDLKGLKKSQSAILQLALLDSDLNLKNSDQLVSRLKKIRRIPVLTKLPNGTFGYLDQEVTEDIGDSTSIEFIQGKLNLNLETKTSGSYVLEILNANKEVLIGVPYFVSEDGNYLEQSTSKSELVIQLDAQNVKQGGRVTGTVIAPYLGTAIITVEKERVYAHKIINSLDKVFEFDFDIPEGLEGNGYIQITMMRSIEDSSIYKSPLAYATSPFFLERTKYRNPISLDFNKSIHSGKSLDVAYSSEVSGKAVIYAVDEGILAVANYKTPKPLDFFMQKQALEVETRQLFDQILPHEKFWRARSKAGGGMDSLASRHLNPFRNKNSKPAVFWSGVLDIGPEPGAIKIPTNSSFDGSMKVIAIVFSEGKMDYIEKRFIAKNPIIVSAFPPPVVAPSDKFVLPVQVLNQIDFDLDQKDALVPIKLQVLIPGESGNKAFKIENVNPNPIKLKYGQEIVKDFEVEVQNNPGSYNIKILVDGAGFKNEYSFPISIRPPYSPRFSLNQGRFYSERIELTDLRKLYTNRGQKELLVSASPELLMRPFAKYLEQFQYSCTEQMLSRMVAMSHFINWAPILKDWNLTDVNPLSFIEDAILKLGHRQASDGGFGFFSSSSPRDLLLSSYASMVLDKLVADQVYVPENIISSLDYYLGRTLKQLDISSPRVLLEHSMATYQLTHHGFATSKKLSILMQRLEDFRNTSNQGPNYLSLVAAYLAASFELLDQKGKALKLLSYIEMVKGDSGGFVHAFLDVATLNAQLLYILNRHFPEKSKELELFTTLLSSIENNQITTSLSGNLILATSGSKSIELKDMQVSASSKTQQKGFQSLELNRFPSYYIGNIPLDHSTVELKRNNSFTYPTYYQVIQDGFDSGYVDTKSSKIEIHTELQDETGNTLKESLLGESLNLVVHGKAIKGGFIDQGIVQILLPAGFKVENSGVEIIGLSPRFVETREDRVLVYSQITEETFTVKIEAKPMVTGDFTLPSSMIEDMYRPFIRVSTAPSRIAVRAISK